MLSRQPTIRKGSEDPSPDQEPTSRRATGSAATPRSQLPATPIYHEVVTRINPNAPRHETKGIRYESSSEANTSLPEWRREVKNPYSKLKNQAKKETPPRIPSLQAELACVEQWEDVGATGSK